MRRCNSARGRCGPPVGVDGATAGFVHRFVRSGTTAAGVLLLLHGGGADETELLEFGSAVGPRFALLSLRGRVEEDGVAWFYGGPGRLALPRDELARRVEEVAAFLPAAAAAYGFGTHRLVAVGYSSGAVLAARLLVARPDLVAGALLLHPPANPLPARLPDLGGRPVLVLSDRSDPLAPPAMIAELASRLRSAGAEVTVVHQLDGHGLGDDDVVQGRRWLAAAAGRSARSRHGLGRGRRADAA